LIDFFGRGASLYPERACFHDGTRGHSYGEVALASNRIANALIDAGHTRGTVAATLAPNTPEAFIVMLGIQRAGATWLTLNARNALAELLHVLNWNGCRVLFYHSDFAREIGAIRAAVPSLERFICIDRADGATQALADWVAGQPATEPDIHLEPDDVAMIKSTGGTTGTPKSVLQSHRCLETMVANFLACMPAAMPPVHLVAAPITHGAGTICYPLMALGATNIILAKADPGLILSTIERFRVTTLFLPPTVIYMLLAHPDLRKYDYSSLQYFIYAAAPMSVEKLKEAMDVFGPVMAQCYGQAEAPMICTYLSPQEHAAAIMAGDEKRLSSCGRATPFTRVAIMDDAGKLLADGQAGEIVVRSQMVMKGYNRNPEANAEAAAFGWHHTGDIGIRDEDGYFHVVDRKKDMIISGGFNIFPSEIEQALWAHPAVQDCAVVGVPDEKWGEAVKAVVERKAGATVEAEALLAWCRARVGRMKAPKSVEFWDELPRSPVGKVLKKEVRQRFWQGRTRNI